MTLTWINSTNTEKLSEQEINALENKYNILLPHNYKEMLKMHSGEESEELEAMIKASSIINMHEHGGEFFCLSYMNSQDLEKVFPIFETCAGNYYALDYSVLNNKGEPTIIDIDHEVECEDATEITRFDSFDEFIKQMSPHKKLKI